MGSTSTAEVETLAGLRVGFVGKLAGMTKREAQRIVRQHGATIVEPIDAELDLVVMGEADFPLELGTGASGPFAADVQAGIEAGRITTITETQLWQRLGFVEGEQNIHRLYTPAMLADLLGVPLAIIRRWHRRGLIVPARQVRRLPYFDFAEVATARRLAELLAAGVTPAAIEKKLGAWRRHLPAVERPLAQLSIIVQGRDLLLRQGEGLIEPGGQLRIDFEALTAAAGAADESDSTTATLDRAEPADVAMPDALIKGAEDLEDEGDLEAATESYRAALVAGGPNAEVCLRLAELLYRQGDLTAARERYYAALEIDEDYVEARANLGCVLAELGQFDLAIAAFHGALALHADYADVHYQLARTLDEAQRGDEALLHWKQFLTLAPTSPWADIARQRIES